MRKPGRGSLCTIAPPEPYHCTVPPAYRRGIPSAAIEAAPAAGFVSLQGIPRSARNDRAGPRNNWGAPFPARLASIFSPPDAETEADAPEIYGVGTEERIICSPASRVRRGRRIVNEIVARLPVRCHRSSADSGLRAFAR